MATTDVATSRPRRHRLTLRRRIGAALVATLLVGLGYSLWPVCTPIPPERVASFETLYSLEQRARRGEPFERRNGVWCICKSRLVRAMTF